MIPITYGAQGVVYSVVHNLDQARDRNNITFVLLPTVVDVFQKTVEKLLLQILA